MNNETAGTLYINVHLADSFIHTDVHYAQWTTHLLKALVKKNKSHIPDFCNVTCHPSPYKINIGEVNFFIIQKELFSAANKQQFFFCCLNIQQTNLIHKITLKEGSS